MDEADPFDWDSIMSSGDSPSKANAPAQTGSPPAESGAAAGGPAPSSSRAPAAPGGSDEAGAEVGKA